MGAPDEHNVGGMGGAAGVAAREVFDRVVERPRGEWEGLLAAEMRAGAGAGVVAHVRELLEFVAGGESAGPDEAGAAGEGARSRQERIAEVKSSGGDSLTLLKGLRKVVDGLVGPPMPERIGRYALEVRLGEGAYGVVYLATQMEPVQRRVALKILKSGLHSESLLRRFEQERQSLAAMNHPNVAAVYDAGCAELGLPYIVMEYVPGVSITRYCDERRLSLRQRLELFIPVCEAVQHAHSKGIIHRDIKPSNVLVMESDGNPPSHAGVPKVIDFGVAKAVERAREGKEAFTRAGEPMGTPDYMSPEQAESGKIDIDTRSDVYSLGVLLYELLAGVPPFDPESMRSASAAEIQRMIRELEPPTPSARLMTLGSDDAAVIEQARRMERGTLVANLRAELEWIPIKAMRKDRERRYISAAELAADVRRYLDVAPIVAAPDSPVYRARKFVGRNRGFVIAGSLVLASLLGWLVTSLYLLDRAWKAEEEAQNAAAMLKSARETAKAVSQVTTLKERVSSFEEGYQRLGALAQALGAERQPEQALRVLNALIEEVERTSGLDNENWASFQGLRLQILRDGGHTEDDSYLRDAMRFVRVCESSSKINVGWLLVAYDRLAYALAVRKDDDGAFDCHRKQFEAMRKSGRMADFNVEPFSHYIEGLLGRGRLDDVISVAQEYRENAAKSTVDDWMYKYSQAVLWEVNTFEKQGRYDLAAALSGEAADLMDARAPNFPDLGAFCRVRHAQYLAHDPAHLQEAIGELKQAEALVRKPGIDLSSGATKFAIQTALEFCASAHLDDQKGAWEDLRSAADKARAAPKP